MSNVIIKVVLLNPIIAWNGYILDGHTRYRILKKHGFIKFEVEEEIDLRTSTKRSWVLCKNQLGRRNLSPERKKFLLGKEYESTKLAVGAPLGSKHGIRKCGQNDHISQNPEPVNALLPSTALEKTVRRAEKYSQGIDAAEEAVPGAQEDPDRAHQGNGSATCCFPAIPKEERPAILDELRKEKGKRIKNLLSKLKPKTSPAKVCATENRRNLHRTRNPQHRSR